MAAFTFHASVQDFFDVISKTKHNELTTQTTDNVWSNLPGSDSEKKSALDQAFRQILTKRLEETGNIKYLLLYLFFRRRYTIQILLCLS